jgi:hypothetical protein
MKRVIDGVTYNTDTSTHVATARWNGYRQTDWRNEMPIEFEGDLYLSRGGAFFVVITEPENEETRPVFEPMSREQAEKWVMEGDVELFDESVFTAPPEATGEGETEATIYIRLPRPLKERIETAAQGEGVSLNAWVMRCVERCAAPDRKGGEDTASAAGTFDREAYAAALVAHLRAE